MGKEKKKSYSDKAENNTKESKLDALMIDSEGQDSENKGEEEINFKEFMAEYHAIMKQIPDNKSKETVEEEKKDYQEEFLIPRSPRKKQTKKQGEQQESKKSDNNWSEKITLAPEEYEDLDDGQGMHEELPEEDTTPDFNLGETSEESDDKFQLSINFEGENKPAVYEDVEKEKKYDPENPRVIDWIFDLAEMFVFVLAAVIILTSFIFKHAEVKGSSMFATLEHRDHLIISNLFYTPKRYDVIVFQDHSINDADLREPLVKRIIGLPGEKVEIKVADDNTLDIYINDVLLEEDYGYYLPINNPSDYGPKIVGEGEVFVLGDNRYNSTDSRDSRIGTVEIDRILGKVLLRFYPFDAFGFIE